MCYCTAISISNFIAEITSRYLYVLIILSMKQIQQVPSAPMNDILIYPFFVSTFII